MLTLSDSPDGALGIPTAYMKLIGVHNGFIYSGCSFVVVYQSCSWSYCKYFSFGFLNIKAEQRRRRYAQGAKSVEWY